MLQLTGVSKRYADQTVLFPTDLQVDAGQICVVIGPSGCGKSTLLRLAIGLVRSESGTVAFQGDELTADNIASQRTRMGYVIQEGGLFPHLTVERNVSLMARQIGWGVKRIRDRVEELLDLTHLPGDALDRYPSQLSGGQRQRVSLMRALMLDPDLLLLDEPLGALDPMIRAELQQELREIFRTLGKAVLLVTHDISEAAYFADIVVLLRAGRIVQQGPIHDLLASPSDEFVKRFISAQRRPLEEDAGDST